MDISVQTLKRRPVVVYTSFQGHLLDTGLLLKKACATRGAYWIQGANSNFYGIDMFHGVHTVLKSPSIQLLVLRNP